MASNFDLEDWLEVNDFDYLYEIICENDDQIAFIKALKRIQVAPRIVLVKKKRAVRFQKPKSTPEPESFSELDSEPEPASVSSLESKSKSASTTTASATAAAASTTGTSDSATDGEEPEEEEHETVLPDLYHQRSQTIEVRDSDRESDDEEEDEEEEDEDEDGEADKKEAADHMEVEEEEEDEESSEEDTSVVKQLLMKKVSTTVDEESESPMDARLAAFQKRMAARRAKTRGPPSAKGPAPGKRRQRARTMDTTVSTTSARATGRGTSSFLKRIAQIRNQGKISRTDAEVEELHEKKGLTTIVDRSLAAASRRRLDKHTHLGDAPGTAKVVSDPVLSPKMAKKMRDESPEQRKAKSDDEKEDSQMDMDPMERMRLKMEARRKKASGKPVKTRRKKKTRKPKIMERVDPFRNTKAVAIRNEELRDFRGDFYTDRRLAMDRSKLARTFEAGDSLFFMSKDDRMYVPGTFTEQSGTPGFIRVAKVVNPDNRDPSADDSESDMSRYVRVRPPLIKYDGYYKMLKATDFEVEFSLELAKILRDKLGRVVHQLKRQAHYRSVSERALRAIGRVPGEERSLVEKRVYGEAVIQRPASKRTKTSARLTFSPATSPRAGSRKKLKRKKKQKKTGPRAKRGKTIM